MKAFNSTLCPLLFFLFIATTPVFSLDLKSKIDPFASQLVEDKLAVGLVVGIYKNGERLILGYGETKKGSGILPTGKTVYEIGSLTKLFTGTILADMVNRGEVKLDDPVNQFLPDNGKLHDSAHPITLLELATHTSGIPYVPDAEPVDMKNPYASFTFDQLHAYLHTLVLPRAPGLYEYSNTGMGVLGNALAAKAEMTYEALVISRICDPLHMTETHITSADEMKLRMAAPYDADLNETKNWDLPSLAGAGAIRSTCDDMLTFAAASMSYKTGPLGKAFALAHTEHFASPVSPSVGLGWHIAKDGKSRWHNGGTGGYSSMLVVIPDSALAVVILCNTGAYERITTLGEQLAVIASGKEVPLPPSYGQQILIDSTLLKSYAGVYAFTPAITLTVTHENGVLKAQVTGQSAFSIYPKSETEFFFKVIDAQIFFVTDSTGRVEKLILHQSGIDQIAVRQ